MALSTQPYKGTRDFFPAVMRLRRKMFGKLAEVVESFGFEEYDGPMLEPFELYAAKTGEEIVNQQLYWFEDRGQRKVAMRPEMTPTLARMVASQFHELPKPVRWYSIPNLWRYERPQRGRLREHWQLNVDILGGDPLYADVEILKVAYSVMDTFGGGNQIEIRMNHRGLMDSLFKDVLGLSIDVSHQAMKAIDSRSKIGEEAYDKWLSETGLNSDQKKNLEEFFHAPFDQVRKQVPGPGSEHLQKIFNALKGTQVVKQLHYDPSIMRGMDYYTGMVFEIYDSSPENRRALFGGGRYDNLLGLFGKNELSGIGFGMGDVGLQNFLETHAILPEVSVPIDVYVTLPDEALYSTAEEVASRCRDSGLRVVTPLGAGKFGTQLKIAAKMGARFVVLLGAEELAKKRVALKNLGSGEQVEVSIDALAEQVKKMMSEQT